MSIKNRIRRIKDRIRRVSTAAGLQSRLLQVDHQNLAHFCVVLRHPICTTVQDLRLNR